MVGNPKRASGWDTDEKWPRRMLSDVTITIDTQPIDETGCLMHAEDATAQLCLALVRLGTELDDRGLTPTAISRLRVLALDREDAVGLVEVVVEWLHDTAAEITCLEVERLPVNGMLAALSADVTASTEPSTRTPTIH